MESKFQRSSLTLGIIQNIAESYVLANDKAMARFKFGFEKWDKDPQNHLKFLGQFIRDYLKLDDFEKFPNEIEAIVRMLREKGFQYEKYKGRGDNHIIWRFDPNDQFKLDIWRATQNNL
jgi:hypothetical protein